MYKVLIADDEPLIREGISESLDWKALDMNIVGMADDGEEALQIVRREKPDICLIDICMPKMNGLDLISKIKAENPNTITIIITGHDEFDYAQKAVKLNVFDYILKPVIEDELLKVVEKAKKELETAAGKQKWYEMANAQLKRNLPVLMHSFVSAWLQGNMTKDEVEELLEFHGIKLGEGMGLILVKTRDIVYNDKSKIEWERQLLLFAIKNIYEELLEPMKPFVTIRDENDNLVSIVTVNNEKLWQGIKLQIESSVEKFLNHAVVVYLSEVVSGLDEIPYAFEEIKKAIYSDSHCLPIIKKVKTYAEKNFRDSELSLQKIADDMGITINHLSKLFKQEMGMSFIEYLIKFRITEAIKLMNDPSVKIYEVAEQVGYSTQHYFCAAFKKVLGVSPTEYRQRKLPNT